MWNRPKKVIIREYLWEMGGFLWSCVWLWQTLRYYRVFNSRQNLEMAFNRYAIVLVCVLEIHFHRAIFGERWPIVNVCRVKELRCKVSWYFLFPSALRILPFYRVAGVKRWCVSLNFTLFLPGLRVARLESFWGALVRLEPIFSSTFCFRRDSLRVETPLFICYVIYASTELDIISNSSSLWWKLSNHMKVIFVNLQIVAR